jgi:hypothetical protein
VISAPSAYLQVRPNFHRDEVLWIDPPGFAIHALRDGNLISQVESVPFVSS